MIFLYSLLRIPLDLEGLFYLTDIALLIETL